MKEIEKMIDESFELNIDTKEEFKKFASENNLVDDTNEAISNFYNFKRNAVIGLVSLSVLLVVSLGVNIGVLGDDWNNNINSYYKMLNDSVEGFNDYINNDTDVCIFPKLTNLVADHSLICVYNDYSNYYIQFYIRLDYINSNFYCYLNDKLMITEKLIDRSTIINLGDIRNYDVDIILYVNSTISHTFSFKI